MSHPTFYHRSVLLHQSIDGLAIRPDGVYVDCTFGGGGHSKEILERLGPKGMLIAFDHDKDAWANQPEDARLQLVRENFRYIRRFLRYLGHPKVDGILADLGVSSHQFDTGERGFSTRFEGPLDMRMDDRLEGTAADILAKYSEAQLHKLFEMYGELRNAKQLAKQIVTSRNSGALKSIDSFKALIAPVTRGLPQKYLAQVFQALRIEVNEELEALKELLEAAPGCLKKGGRLSIITFHSLEDRMVKQAMKGGTAEKDAFGRVTGTPDWKVITTKPIEATEAELKQNPRARSARLRIAERL